MDLHFYKYQGTGNDFIMIDNRKEHFDPTNTELVKFLCDRRFGIGADGLILLESYTGFDFNMVYFNSDGRTSSMCGNGGRCIVKFAHDLGVVGNETTFIAVDGEHDAIIKDGLVYLKMIDVLDIEKQPDFFYMNTGSPHYVEFVKNVDEYPVYAEGYKIRNNDRFKKVGTNVNFVESFDDKTIKVRTYERGVEDETFSCGTGVTASAIAASFTGYASPINVITKGGNLTVSFSTEDQSIYKDIYLAGPAVQVFQGTIKL